MKHHPINAIFRRLPDRLATFKGSPQRVARAYALGFFLGTTPLVGCKVWIALLLSTLCGWNRPAAVFGVYHINALTGPLFYTLSFVVGKAITGLPVHFVWPEEASLQAVFQAFFGNGNVFLTLLTGGLVLGVPAAFGLYHLSLRVLSGKEPAPGSPDSPGGAYTLITGASTGLGRAFAVARARQGKNLILVALPGEQLPRIGAQLSRTYGVQVQTLELDLTLQAHIRQLEQQVAGYFPVDCLINNAGIGGTSAILSTRPEALDRMIRLNVEATTMLTRLILPELMQHRQAYILNVASMASFTPLAYKTVYSASKAFVYAFSRALQEELRGTPVSVSVLHPGPILTNFDCARRIIAQGALGKMGLLSPGELARIALRQMQDKRVMIIPGLANQFNYWLMQMVPGTLRIRLLSGVFRRELALTACSTTN